MRRGATEINHVSGREAEKSVAIHIYSVRYILHSYHTVDVPCTLSITVMSLNTGKPVYLVVRVSDGGSTGPPV